MGGGGIDIRFYKPNNLWNVAKDPTKTTERKVQNALRKIKSSLPENKYKR